MPEVHASGPRLVTQREVGGHDAIPQALAAGAKVTGMTVHFVTEGVDEGPILFQRAVEVQPDDTVDSLRRRIQAEEHAHYPRVIDALLRGAWRRRGSVVDVALR